MQYTRPKLIITPTATDKLVEKLGIVLLLLMWIATIAFYFKLPQIIPTHFNAKGLPDDYGNKGTIFILPIIVTIIYAGLTYLNKYPHIFNYPTTITEANATKHYTTATKMLRWLKLIIVVLFLYINLIASLTALGKVNGLGWWFLPIILVAVFSPLVWYFSKIKNEKSIITKGN